jgi:thymidylate kinase
MLGALTRPEEPSPPARETRGCGPTLALVRSLCRRLDEERVDYCHWKSNDALDRSASGENDLDLLIRRAHQPAFAEIVHRLGFKRVRVPGYRDMPGVLDYYGYDDASGKLVHLHAHYQLVVGDDRTKNYRIPLEDALLDSARQGELFRTPAAELELVVFVVRLILKHLVWDAMLEGLGRLSAAERRELAHLESRLDPTKREGALAHCAPLLDGALFESCLAALGPGTPWWRRAWCGMRLQRRLRAQARRAYPVDLGLKAWRRVVLALGRRSGRRSRARFESGGAMIVMLGSDGSGKTTAIDALEAWLAPVFELRRVHLGRPRWSLATTIVRSIVKSGRMLGLYPYVTTASARYAGPGERPVFPGYPVLLRELCAGRDRRITFARARRFANAGGLVICDRFPSSRITTMDGPQIEHLVAPGARTKLVERLIARERRYYEPITAPDCEVVLRLDPELAVARKLQDDPCSVRARAREIWGMDWSGERVLVVDASLPREQVLSTVKSFIWRTL